MRKLFFLVSILFVLISNTIYAGSPHPSKPCIQNNPRVQQFINLKDWSFVENKGQIAALKETNPPLQRGQGDLREANAYIFHPEIKYYGHQGGVYLYCKPGMLSFVFTKTEKVPEQISEATGTTEDGRGDSPFPKGAGGFDPSKHQTPEPAIISTSRTDLVLLGSNPNAEIVASDKQEYYENFYLAYTPEQGITHVHTYKTITYKSVYPHIDMVLQAKENGMEYSFIVYPGGKVSDIQLQWNGVEGSRALENGGFKFTNSLGTLDESAPKSFSEGKLLSSSFAGNGFKVGNYDKGKTLIIDPSMEWSTYYGGDQSDVGLGIAVDVDHYVFVTGRTYSASGISSSGAYQYSFIGKSEAFIAKFSSSGARMWASYFGGPDYNIGSAIAIDPSGNPIITGFTTSSSGIASSGAWQSIYGGGGYDAFIAKFTTSGNRIWSTYYGGSGQEDYDNIFFVASYGGISTDTSGNIYIAGYTNSSSGMASSGAFQTSFSGGNSDAFLAKFSPDGNRLWGTYFGGGGDDFAHGVATDPGGNVFVVGETTSPSGISSGSGAYQSVIAGQTDVFIANFSPSGARIWSTYFGGKSDDIGQGITTDFSGNLYITGWTASDSGVATAGTHKSSLQNGLIDAFVEKFSNSGQKIWGSYFGGHSTEYGFGISVDHYHHVLITGETESDSAINTTGISYPMSNSFVADFSDSGQINWAGYAGSGYTILKSIATDNIGRLFFTGSTVSDTGIASSGAWQSSRGGLEDVVISKMSYHLSGIQAQVNEPLSDISIFPNPFKSTIYLNYHLKQKSVIEITITDITGKQIASIINENEVPGLHQLYINAEKYHLHPGVYLLKFIVNDEVESRRLVKF